MHILIGWMALIGASFVIGGLTARFWKRRNPPLASGFVVWFVFLVVNILSEQLSADLGLV